jgi:biotin synthase
MVNGVSHPSPGNSSFLPDYHQLLLRGSQQEELHQRAASIAREHFGQKVFVRGVVEISNYCRQNCVYCGMRRENRDLRRFRASPQQLAELLLDHLPESVTDINIQGGEDPVAVREVALPLIETLRKQSGLGISVCLGSLSPALYRDLQEAGASIYILKFETGTPTQYEALQAPGSLRQRIENIRYLAAHGWKVSSGFIAGLPGQLESEMRANFALAADLPLDGCSVSPFIPGDETPISAAPRADIEMTLNAMALLRLMRPEWVIPAVSALNLAQPGSGYRRGLRTGANLVTINLTPDEFRGDYLLYKRERFIMTEQRIVEAIHAEGLVPSKVGLAEFYRSKSPALTPAAV